MRPTASDLRAPTRSPVVANPADGLRLHAVHDRVEVLGPGPCAAIWVQGCALACEGCMTPASWDADTGVRADVMDVASWLSGLEVSRLTISGGEPMDQAPALTSLVDLLRDDRDWLVTCYSGYRREVLERDVRRGTRDLLARLDLLVDGPFRADLHVPLLWRGSSNQRLHLLSDRIALPDDQPAGCEITVSSGGQVEVIGVWPTPDAQAEFEHQLGASSAVDGLPEVPFPFPTRKG